MPKVLRGWEFQGTHKPLRFVEKEMAPLKPDYVRLKVINTGLCHSDVGALEDEGWLEIIKLVPVIMGHEIAGEVVELGSEVTGFEIGDRVAVCPMPYKDEIGPGYTRDGGYANYTTSPAAMLVKVPENVSMVQAAASTDAGMTSYHAIVKRGGVKKGTKVGIIGLGGLGTVGMDIALALGAEVYVATRKESAQQKARDAGAKKVVSNILELKDEGLEVIVDFAGSGTTTADALEAVGFGGSVVLVGMAKLETTLNCNDLILKNSSLLGSCGGTREDIEEILNMMSTTGLEVAVEEIPMSQVAEGLKILKAGKADKRLVMRTSEEDFK
ncbi:MAG: zinc-binding dehydrogenase [Clostridiales bacterium]|nr:zinc-binding dehydrogenase [Clostridiales bacterium]